MDPLVKVGRFGVGLTTYWEQFDGLRNRQCLVPISST